MLQVREKDYDKCDRSEPIRGYKDGHTKIELNRSGPFYFISGEEGHCQRGEKLLVVVLSPNHHNKSVAVAPAAAPAPAPVNAIKHMITNKGSLNGAWSFFLLLPLGLLV